MFLFTLVMQYSNSWVSIFLGHLTSLLWLRVMPKQALAGLSTLTIPTIGHTCLAYDQGRKTNRSRIARGKKIEEVTEGASSSARKATASSSSSHTRSLSQQTQRTSLSSTPISSRAPSVRERLSKFGSGSSTMSDDSENGHVFTASR